MIQTKGENKMFTVKKDDFDENTDDILNSINAILNKNQGSQKEEKKEEKKEQ